MPRASRASVTGLSRSGRPIRSVVISDSSSASPSPEPAPTPNASIRNSKYDRRQSSLSSMAHNNTQARILLPQADPTQASTTSRAKAEHKSKPSITVSDRRASEEVEEYIFSSDEDMDDGGDMGDMDDTRSHISLSSDDPPAEHHGIDAQPWLHMSRPQRMEYENMFIMPTNPAVGQSWSYTEDYQMQVDNLLLMYMQDYPLPTWVIGQEAAERAYHEYRERSRWRLLGIRIYATDRLADIFNPRSSYPVPAAAQPIPQRINSNEMPVRAQQATPMPPTESPPAIHAQDVLPQPDIPVEASQPSPISTIEAEESAQPSRAGSDSATSYVQPAQSHAHPPRPRPHLAKYTKVVSKKKAKDEDMDTPPPPPRPTTPPYPARERPPERPNNCRTGKLRKHAESKLFPWNRDLDYRALSEAATWREDIYNEETLKLMAEVREHNESIIERLDHEVTEKQRVARNNKKLQLASDVAVESPARPGRKKKDPNDKSDNNDPYHAGYFAFATPEMEARAKQLGCHNPDYVLRAGANDELTLNELESIKLCWYPGRKGLSYELVQAPFSARDTVLTRKQLASTVILTRRAAECIIDFSPDLLWRDVLLRICSEAGCGNKDVRDRFCLNGCHADKATFTKRISAALGQKQTKGYAPHEWEFYQASGEDFKNYIEFFGKRATTRNMKTTSKHRPESMAPDSSGLEDDHVDEKIEEGDGGGTTLSNLPSDHVERESEDDIEMEDADEDDEAVETDAVSIQDSDALDMMSD